jgi:hypothetical protein
MADVISYPDAIATLREWLAALSSASSGQSYSIGGRTLTRQDITEIRSEIQRWHNTVTALEAKERGEQRPLGAQAAFPTPGSGVTGGGTIIPGELWKSGLT